MHFAPMIEISNHKMYIYIFLPVTMLKSNYGHVILPHFVVEQILYILPQVSHFPSNALVKYNVGISCSASLKALYLYGLIIFQRLIIIQIRVTGSLLTSLLERFERKGNVEQICFMVHLVCAKSR